MQPSCHPSRPASLLFRAIRASRSGCALASSFLVLGTASPAGGSIIATFDLTSAGTVVYSVANGNYPATFTADTGITVNAYAGYDGAQNSIKTNIHTAPNGAGVVGDPWIEVTENQRLEFGNWSVPGRLVGFTLREDDVRNGLGSSARLFGGASGTTLIGIWNMTNGETLVVDLSGFTGLDQTNLFNFRTTVDVDSSFAVTGLKWEYVPEPSAALLSLAGFGSLLVRRRRA